MFHIALTMRLKPGKLDGYRRAHDALWPGIAESMRKNRVSMAIYHEEGRLTVFAVAPTRKDWERSRESPLLEQWNKAMTEFLEPDEEGGIAFAAPEKVFGFGEFAEGD